MYLYPFYEATVALRCRKCDDISLGYDCRSAKMTLETGPTGTRFQTNDHATTFVCLKWETTLHGLVKQPHLITNNSHWLFYINIFYCLVLYKYVKIYDMWTKYLNHN